MGAPPFEPKHHPDLSGARARSTPVNTGWLAGPLATAAAMFADIRNPDEIEARAGRYLADLRQVETLVSPLIRALAIDPWFEPPFKVSRDRLRTGVVLLDGPAIAFSISITSAAELNQLPPPATFVLPGRVTLTRYVRGGGALVRRWEAEPAGPDFSASAATRAREQAPILLHDGALIRQDGQTCGHIFTGAESDVVALTATIKLGACPLMREYATADGAFVRTACADDAASRIEMLLTFLRVSGRADAGAVFDGASRHPAFHLRWAAMREWLMLDANAARARLVEISSGDPNAEVRAAAAATLPKLDRRLVRQCPA